MFKKFIYPLLLIALCSCYEDESYQTIMIIDPVAQLASGETEYVSVDSAMAYAFVADTAQWCFSSYDDALSGIMTSREDGSKLEAFAAAVPYTGEEYRGSLEIAIAQESILLLAIDIENQTYAYRLYEVGLNLPITQMTIPFYPWKAGSYTNGNWEYVAPETTEE